MHVNDRKLGENARVQSMHNGFTPKALTYLVHLAATPPLTKFLEADVAVTVRVHGGHGLCQAKSP